MRFCLVRAPLASLGATLLAACTSLIDDMRNDVEGTPTVMAEAQANQKLALVDGCLASVIGGQPLRAIMARMSMRKKLRPRIRARRLLLQHGGSIAPTHPTFCSFPAPPAPCP
jgi:hypothetical protein